VVVTLVLGLAGLVFAFYSFFLWGLLTGMVARDGRFRFLLTPVAATSWILTVLCFAGSGVAIAGMWFGRPARHDRWTAARIGAVIWAQTTGTNSPRARHRYRPRRDRNSVLTTQRSTP